MAEHQVRTVGYGRLSKSKGGLDDSVSIQIQKMDYEAFCTSRGYVSDGWFYDDGVSGAKTSRPGWDALVQTLNGQVLIARDLSRIGRTVEMLAQLNRLAQSSVMTGIEFTNGGSPGTGYIAQQTIGFMMVAAQAERDAGRERQQRRLAFNRSLNIPQSGGKRPFGTLADKRTPVPEEVERIREACEYVTAGGTLGRLATKWADEDVKTSVGGVFTFQKLRSLLVNPRLDDLVGPEIARPCRQSIEARHKVRAHSVVLTRWLRDVLVCELCGRKLSTHAVGGKTQYSCTKPEGCGKVHVSAERTEAVFAEFLLTIVLPVAQADDAHATLIADRTKIVSKIENLQQMREDGDMDRATFQKRKAVQDVELAKVDQAIMTASASTAMYSFLQTDGETGMVTGWDLLTPQQKRSVAQMQLGTVTVGPNTTPGRFDLSRFKMAPHAVVWWRGFLHRK